MKVRILAATVSMLALALPTGAMAQRGGDDAVMRGQGKPTVELILEQLDGRAPTIEGTMTSYTLDGPVSRSISWEEFTELLEGTAAGGLPEPPGSRGGTHACPVSCEQDQGQGLPGYQYFFCDDSSGWQVRFGLGSSSGILVQIPGGAGTPVCGFGPAVNWTAVVISPKVAGGTLAYEGCFADTWTNHASGYCPLPFSANDTWNNAFIAQGNGELYTFTFPNVFSLDYFIGGQAQVRYL